MKKPVFSIITICFENGKELDGTLESVEPKYKNDLVEQIVVDGSSGDSCEKVVRKYPWVDHYIHERDDGRYDAMNKGIYISNGVYLLFLNSGDRFHEDFNIDSALASLQEGGGRTVYYGDSVKDTGNSLHFNRVSEHITTKNFIKGKGPSHQSVFLPAWFCLDKNYDLSLSISADTKLMISAFENLDSKHLGQVIAVFALGGASNNSKSLSEVFLHWEQRRIARGLGVIPYLPSMLKSLSKYFLIRVFGHEKYYDLTLRAKKRK